MFTGSYYLYLVPDVTFEVKGMTYMNKIQRKSHSSTRLRQYFGFTTNRLTARNTRESRMCFDNIYVKVNIICGFWQFQLYASTDRKNNGSLHNFSFFRSAVGGHQMPSLANPACTTTMIKAPQLSYKLDTHKHAAVFSDWRFNISVVNIHCLTCTMNPFLENRIDIYTKWS